MLFSSCSGIFGVFLSLSNIKLVENQHDKAEFSKINGMAKVRYSRAGVVISKHLSIFCKCSEIAGAYVKFDQPTCFSNLNLSIGCYYELYTF